MVHDQLVDYISSQMKLGVSREAIASALVSAGWVAGDVEDTIKKVESTKTAQPAAGASAMSSGAMSSAKPMGMTGTGATGMGTMGASPMGTMSAAKPATMSTGTMTATTTATATATAMKPMGSAGPQVIKVSDLVSTTPGSTVKKADPPADAGKFGGKITGNSFQAATATAAPKKGGSGMKIVAIVLIVIFAAAAGYFYWQNTTLAAKISSLTGSSSQINTQLTDLQTKLNSATADSSNAVNTLTQENTDLALELSFFAAAKDATTSQATIGGVLAVGNAKDPYKITTPRSADIYITSATASKILTTLKSLVGDTVQVAGTYIPGSDQLTITSILLPAQPASTATSTATSTMSAASTTTTAKTSTTTSTGSSSSIINY